MSIAFVFRRTRAFGLAFAALALVALAPGLAAAQAAPPDADQYLVYRAFSSEPPLGQPVILKDQFSAAPITHVVDDLQFFANPVDKGDSPIIDPRLHYTWWHITPQPFSLQVLASNKYGDQLLNLRAAEYLLNPALKFPQPGETFPLANHYKCYHADGFIDPRFVILTDQFGTWDLLLTGKVEYFCPPVEKTWSDGTTEPIIRPDVHLVCYELLVPQTTTFPISFLDEFRFGNAILESQVMLCVPSIKHEIVPAKQATWGSLKATYR